MAIEKTADLPFEPNLDSLSGWLAGLPSKDRERYAGLYAGLQALNAAKLPPSFHLQALEQFRPLVFEAAANLTSMFLGKPLPLEPAIRKLAKLSAQFHSELGIGYYAISQARGFARHFNADEQGKIIHRLLRCYAQTLLCSALMYEAAASSTWQRLNEAYRLADRSNLLSTTEACPELANQAPCSAEQLYVRLQVFRLMGPYRMSQDDIQKAFDLVQQYGNSVLLSSFWAEEGKKADFSVDLNSGAAPQSLSRQHSGTAGDLRYLFLGSLRRTFEALGRPPLNKDATVSSGLLNYLRIRLGESPSLLADTKSRNSTLLAGYKNLVQTMTQPETKAGLTLQPLDEHELPPTSSETSKTTGKFNTAAKPLSGMAKPTGSANESLACHVYPASLPGFYVIEASGLELPSGLLLGLFTDNKLIQFGISCAAVGESAPNMYGFELLAVQVGLVKVSFDANPRKTYSCFLSSLGNNGRCSLITEPLRLRGGDGMNIMQKIPGKGIERYRVAKLLEKTEEFCQYEIVLETPKPSQDSPTQALTTTSSSA
jgi:hypothetical protein